MELPRIEQHDFPSGTCGLRYGLYAVIGDSDTPLERQIPAMAKCPLTKMSAKTCVCWKCRGLSANPVSPERRTPQKR